MVFSVHPIVDSHLAVKIAEPLAENDCRNWLYWTLNHLDSESGMGF